MRSFKAVGLSFLLFTTLACEKDILEDFESYPQQKTEMTPDEAYYAKQDSLEAYNLEHNFVNSFMRNYANFGSMLHHDTVTYLTATEIIKDSTRYRPSSIPKELPSEEQVLSPVDSLEHAVQELPLDTTKSPKDTIYVPLLDSLLNQIEAGYGPTHL